MSAIEGLSGSVPAAETDNNIPLRPRASTRFSQAHSYRSTPTEPSRIASVDSYTFSSGQASPFSGEAQTLAVNDQRNGSEVSSSDAAVRAMSTNLDVELLRDRLTSRDFVAEPEGIFDNSFLEPRPFERVKTNLSEIITAQPNTIRDSIDLTRFGGHRDTFAILGIRRRQSRDIDLPARFFERLIQFIDFETYLAIRLSCRSWSAAISQVCPLVQWVGPRVPIELFIDAESGNVCLGIDNHNGTADRVRSSIIVIFVSPKTAQEDERGLRPTCYAAAAELPWGPRVVVGYEDGSIYLFTVPSNVLHAGHGGDQWYWLESWSTRGVVNEGRSASAVWPVEVSGNKIGSVDGLTDVAIQDEQSGIRVWTSSFHHRRFSWDLGGGEQDLRKLSTVLHDGIGPPVKDQQDVEGDWEMRDAPRLRQTSGFDGTGFETPTLDVPPRSRRESSDVTMHDVDEDEGYYSCEDNEVVAPRILGTSIRSHRQSHNTPLQRSDMSMRDVSDEHHEPAIHALEAIYPDIPYNANKRRRLNNTADDSREGSNSTDDQERGFDADQQTIEWVSSAFAISVPSTRRRWSGSGLDAEDWVPDFLGTGMEWDEQVDSEMAGEGSTNATSKQREDARLDLWTMAREKRGMSTSYTGDFLPDA